MVFHCPSPTVYRQYCYSIFCCIRESVFTQWPVTHQVDRETAGTPHPQPLIFPLEWSLSAALIPLSAGPWAGHATLC